MALITVAPCRLRIRRRANPFMSLTWTQLTAYWIPCRFKMRHSRTSMYPMILLPIAPLRSD